MISTSNLSRFRRSEPLRASALTLRPLDRRSRAKLAPTNPVPPVRNALSIRFELLPDELSTDLARASSVDNFFREVPLGLGSRQRLALSLRKLLFVGAGAVVGQLNLLRRLD